MIMAVKNFYCLVSIDRTHLVLGSAGLGELEVDTLPSQSFVDLTVSVEPVVDTTPLLLVKDDLEDLAAVLLGPDALANNLNGIDKVLEDSVVDSGECAGTRALLGLSGAGAVRALGARKNTAGSDDQDVSVRELLLQLAGEAVCT